jgi:hypothetical protein
LIDGRLTELNAYCTIKVISSLFELAKVNGLQSFKYGELLYLVPTFGVLAHCKENYPHAIHGIMEPVLKWLFVKDVESSN